MKKFLLLFSLITIVISGCINDDIIEDFVEPSLRITTTPDTILIDTVFQFEFLYFNNIGVQEDITPTWSSSNTEVVTIDQNGLATAIAKGQSTIGVSFEEDGNLISEEFLVNVGGETVIIPNEIGGTIATTTFYVLEGDFSIIETESGITINISDNYRASAALPGLFIYLSNNANSIANAMEISEVEVFAGQHSYSVDGVGPTDYNQLLYFCKPFNVKVGNGEIKELN